MENLAYLEKKLLTTSWKWILGAMLDRCGFMSSSWLLREICITDFVRLRITDFAFLFVAEDIARMISCQMAKWRLQGQPRDIQLALGSGSNGRHQGHLWCQAASKIYGRAVLQLHGFTIGRNIRCIHKIFYSIQQLYKEELCATLWIKSFKVKVDKTKIVFISREQKV